MASQDDVTLYVSDGIRDLYVKVNKTSSLHTLIQYYCRFIGEQRQNLLFKCNNKEIKETTLVSSLNTLNIDVIRAASL